MIEKTWFDLTKKSSTNYQGIDTNFFSIYINADYSNVVIVNYFVFGLLL